MIEIDVHRITQASKILKSVAHPHRVKIIELLASNSKMSVGKINEAIQIEQALLSHHLKIMKLAGVLDSERNGKQMMYFISEPTVVEILKCLGKCKY